MIPRDAFVRAFRRNCPNVRMDQDEAVELGRLFREAQDDGKFKPQSILGSVIHVLNEAGVTDAKGNRISELNVVGGIRQLIRPIEATSQGWRT